MGVYRGNRSESREITNKYEFAKFIRKCLLDFYAPACAYCMYYRRYILMQVQDRSGGDGGGSREIVEIEFALISRMSRYVLFVAVLLIG